MSRVRDPNVMRQHALSCRDKAIATDHPGLAKAFLDLADALEYAASVAEADNQGLLH